MLSFCLIAVALVLGEEIEDDPSIVITKYGKLQGVVTTEGREFLKGIFISYTKYIFIICRNKSNIFV